MIKTKRENGGTTAEIKGNKMEIVNELGTVISCILENEIMDVGELMALVFVAKQKVEEEEDD